MSKKSNQRVRILKYLREHPEGITSMEAFELFGITRLSAVVFDLRHQQHNVVTVMETGSNRDGDDVRYARYILKEAKKA